MYAQFSVGVLQGREDNLMVDQLKDDQRCNMQNLRLMMMMMTLTTTISTTASGMWSTLHFKNDQYFTSYSPIARAFMWSKVKLITQSFMQLVTLHISV